jgi:hypothetical protein
MLTKATVISDPPKSEEGYLEAIDGCLREMEAMRKRMKKADAEIRRLRASSRRKLDETWAAIHRVQTTV